MLATLDAPRPRGRHVAERRSPHRRGRSHPRAAAGAAAVGAVRGCAPVGAVLPGGPGPGRDVAGSRLADPRVRPRPPPPARVPPPLMGSARVPPLPVRGPLPLMGSAGVRALLVRGMLAGLVAGVAAFVFAYLFGEPGVDGGIDFEEAGAHTHGGEELVSRGVQSTVGLLVGLLVYAVAIGGIFA